MECGLAHDVFISYTNADKAAADAVCHRLEAAGIRCWIAPRDVGFGDWGALIVDAISDAKLVVMILSAAANASPNVLDEVVTALDGGATVIPFRIEDIRPTGALRLRLSRLNWLDALSQPLDQHIDRLIETTKRVLPAAEAEEARPRQEEELRQAEEELQRRQQEEQQRQAEEELQRHRQEEQHRQAEKELQQRLPVAAEQVPIRKPTEEPARKLVEAPLGPPKTFHHWPAVAAVVIVVGIVVSALTLGGVFKTPPSPPSQQAATNAPTPVERAPQSTQAAAQALQPALAPVSQPAEAPASQPTQAALPAAQPAPPPVFQPAPSPAPALLRTLTGHTNFVDSVAFSPDGHTLASGSWDNTIKLWDTASGQLQCTLTGHTGNVSSIAFSPDGRTLASGSEDKTIKLWDMASGQLMHTLTGHTKGVPSVAYSPDGRMLASGSIDKTIVLWDVSRVNEAGK
jgi:TIR domain/WD domain, G-beta repeat